MPSYEVLNLVSVGQDKPPGQPFIAKDRVGIILDVQDAGKQIADRGIVARIDYVEHLIEENKGAEIPQAMRSNNAEQLEIARDRLSRAIETAQKDPSQLPWEHISGFSPNSPRIMPSPKRTEAMNRVLPPLPGADQYNR